MKKKVVFVGAGGFGREVISFIDKEKFESQGFIDNDISQDFAYPVLGGDEIIPKLTSLSISHAIVTIGDQAIRRKLFEECIDAGLKMPNIIHNSAQVSSAVSSDCGIIIYPGAVITSDVRISKGCLINSGVTIGHDVSIGEFCNINPGANLAGTITIGANTTIGIGAVIKEKINIGANVIIGAGSVVVKDIPSNAIAFGVPARIVNEQSI